MHSGKHNELKTGIGAQDLNNSFFLKDCISDVSSLQHENLPTDFKLKCSHLGYSLPKCQLSSTNAKNYAMLQDIGDCYDRCLKSPCTNYSCHKKCDEKLLSMHYSCGCKNCVHRSEICCHNYGGEEQTKYTTLSDTQYYVSDYSNDLQTAESSRRKSLLLNETQNQSWNGWKDHRGRARSLDETDAAMVCCCQSLTESCDVDSTNCISRCKICLSHKNRALEPNMEHSLDHAPSSLSLPEDASQDTMDTDSSHGLLPNKEISSCSASTSDLSVLSSSSAAIHEDLSSLCLSDEYASSSASQVDQAGCSLTAKVRKYEGYISPLHPSLFPNIPPTISFSTKKEKVRQLPVEIRRLLRWKLSTITPVLIRQTVVRSGFRLTKTENSEWTGTWGKHLKCLSFKTLKDFQKINHFPGSFHLGRKDKLWQNYSKMQALHGTSVFSFFPETFVLPQDIRVLRQIWEHEGSKKRWIVKPPASARGTGIHVVHKWAQIPKKHPLVVQRYISNPYLINGTKFDLRLYVLVTSFDPLRIYIFDDGLVRFASVKYSSSMRSLNDRFMHLTNYSINRKSASYTANEDESVCQGHKWTLKALWRYLNNERLDTTKLWGAIVDIVIKTVISCEGSVTRLIKSYTRSRYNCFELFGFDIMLDNDLKPWLLEVNISPSLHSSSLLDTNVKGQLVKDMFNTVGFQIPNKFGHNNMHIAILAKFGISQEQTQLLCMNKALHRWFLSPDEKSKHSFYEHSSGNDYDSILDDLTPDDIRHLVESEDELSRCGSFIRVFPSASSSGYLKYFEHCRYYNLLLDVWEKKYQADKSEGISLLQSYCKENVHLQMFRKDPLTKYPNPKAVAAASPLGISTNNEISHSGHKEKSENCSPRMRMKMGSPLKTKEKLTSSVCTRNLRLIRTAKWQLSAVSSSPVIKHQSENR